MDFLQALIRGDLTILRFFRKDARRPHLVTMDEQNLSGKGRLSDPRASAFKVHPVQNKDQCMANWCILSVDSLRENDTIYT